MSTLYQVVGFVFSEDLNQVALIRKTHPDWQAGRLNGVGGKQKPEDGGRPLATMIREGQEELGIAIPEKNWHRYAVLKGHKLNGKDVPEYVVHFYWAIEPNVKRIDGGHTDTDEVIEVVRAEYVISLESHVVGNIRWLIMMALSIITGNESALRIRCDEFYTEEFKGQNW